MSLATRIDKLEQNLIINGNLDFWQRGTTFTSIGGGAYSADRFKYLKVGAMVHDITRSTDVPDAKSTYSVELGLTTPDDAIAATEYTIFEQRIEGYNIQDVIGRQVTLSFWVKATTTGTYCIGLTNSGADRAVVAEYTIDTTNTWEKKTITFPAIPTAGTWDYTTGIGLYVRFVLAAGTNFQTGSPGSWESSANFATPNQVNGVATGSTSFKLAQIMLNVGEHTGIFNRAGRNIADELQMCRRYFEKSFPVDIAPANGPDAANFSVFDGIEAVPFCPWVGSPAGHYPTVRFSVEKRANCTIQGYGNNAGLWAYGAIGTFNVPATRTFNANVAPSTGYKTGFLITNNVSTTALVGVQGHWTADAEL